MRRLPLLFLTILLSCSKQTTDNKISADNTTAPVKDSTTSVVVQADSRENYQTSTYDTHRGDLEDHKRSLKELSDSSVFSTIHHQLLSELDSTSRTYFSARPDYEVMNLTHGDLFQNGKDENAFIVYDKKHLRVSILIQNTLSNTYSELYRDIKVKNGLENADCNYGAFGTLDYQFASELIYQRDYLIKKPESHLEYPTFKIVDITKDEDFALDDGCFAPSFSRQKPTSLCISTSAVYNNWECLTYDKSKNEFVISYGQAFAD
jgi:hypothetical protein